MGPLNGPTASCGFPTLLLAHMMPEVCLRVCGKGMRCLQAHGREMGICVGNSSSYPVSRESFEALAGGQAQVSCLLWGLLGQQWEAPRVFGVKSISITVNKAGVWIPTWCTRTCKNWNIDVRESVS